jgi:hypothetical protein
VPCLSLRDVPLLIRPPSQSPQIEEVSAYDTLSWALSLLRWNNAHLEESAAAQSAVEKANTLRSQLSTSLTDMPETMKRRQEMEEESDHVASRTHSSYEFPRLPPPQGMNEERRRLYSAENTSLTRSPHQTPSSTPSYQLPSQSPLQSAQSVRMLPSPSSLNFPVTIGLPNTSPSTTGIPSSAHAAHLQDLQHQISVKTLQLQTLQREYDNLLEKLERQRTKCAILEKKFEVSDVEINTLTDDKEKLQGQIAVLEAQVEELQTSRDEARRQIAANGSQYMRIMEMASRLQAQGAEEKRKWANEREELQERIKTLEEAMLTGSMANVAQNSAEERIQSVNNGNAIAESSLPVTSSAQSTQVVALLRAEVARLRTRTKSLEDALFTTKEESERIQDAARAIAESSKRTQAAAAAITND